MKKKLLLALVMTFVFALALTFAVSAESVHNENTVDYSATVTLDDGAVCNLFDSDGNALIWYISGTDDEGKNIYSSIRADDEKVKYTSLAWENITTNIKIIMEDETVIGAGKFVVFNIMDDDVLINKDAYIGQPVVKLRTALANLSNLEYAYLRLDTTHIYSQCFKNDPKLKYVNLEDLTLLRRIGEGSNFSDCPALFENTVLDLSNTNLIKFDGGSIFDGVPLKGIIFPANTMTELSGANFQNSGLVSVVFPQNLTSVGSNVFKDCKSLTTVYLNGTVTKIGENAFSGCESLNTVFFVGTLAQLETLIKGVSATGNDAFLSVTGKNNTNLISYADYKNLSNKSGKYIVYDYSKCEAYNNGIHGETEAKNACVGVCTTCGDTVVKHNDDKNLSVSISYTNYGKEGTKTIACQNEGCGYEATEETPALFTCLGYSAPEDGRGGIAIGFTVNNVAIAEYEEVTGRTLKYGVFAVLQSRLGDKDIFAQDGTVAEGVINAEITNYEFVAFELKIIGFADEHKDIKLAMGAYVAVTDGETTEYSYMQGGEPNENEKYCFVSYNDIVGAPSTDEEVTQ